MIKYVIHKNSKKSLPCIYHPLSPNMAVPICAHSGQIPSLGQVPKSFIADLALVASHAKQDIHFTSLFRSYCLPS